MTATTSTTPSDSAVRPGASWWAAGTVAVAASLAANLTILGLGHLFGAPMVVPDPESGDLLPVAASLVAYVTAGPLVVGFGAAVLLSLFWKGALRVGQIVGTVLAVASTVMPFLAETDPGTQVVLGVMHLVMAPAVWFGLGAVRRRDLA